MIRYISLNAFIALWSIVMCLFGLAMAFFDKQGRIIHAYCAVPWARVILWVCGIQVNVRGVERVDATKPRIYMTNHQSFFDIFALLACLPVDFKFILKQELMKIPLLGPTMRRAGYIGIERDDPRKAVQSVRAAADRIRNGASVLIFPEGTRSPDGRLQAFRKGGFNLALRSGCDIVPVGINGSHRIAPKGSLKIQKGIFGLSIGTPVSVSGLSKRDTDQLMDRVRREMEKEMETAGSTIGDATRSTVKKDILRMWLILGLILALPARSGGYIMPVDQMVEMMGARFSGFRAMMIEQTTQVTGREGHGRVEFQEKVWIQSPRFVRTEVVAGPRDGAAAPLPATPPETQDQPVQPMGPHGAPPAVDTTFRWLLMVTEPAEILGFLDQLGVNVDAVGFDRLDGEVVYRIGDSGADRCKVLIQRETFLPLLLSYNPAGLPSSGRVTVRFRDYREVGGGWYPHEIESASDEAGSTRYLLRDIRINPPMDASLFEDTVKGGETPRHPESGQGEDERLKEVIRVLKEKYGN